MRRVFPLAKVLLVAAVAVVSTPVAVPAGAGASQVTSLSSLGSASSLICILPRCNGPYCRATNGCWVCCTN